MPTSIAGLSAVAMGNCSMLQTRITTQPQTREGKE
jgi:hypothetical protein